MSAAVLRVRDVHLDRGDRRVLNGMSLEVGRGELVAIMGPSGSGKTTLLRAITGLAPFDAGEIGIDDVTLSSGPAPAQTRRALCRKVGMVFQFHCLFEHLSALDNVCLAPVHAYTCRRRTRNVARERSCRPSAWSTARRRCRANCRAARRSGWRSRERSPSIRQCC